MRIDISKVTVCSVNDENDLLVDGGSSRDISVSISSFSSEITSNRPYTLLHQNHRLVSGHGAKLTLLNVFNSHTPEEIEKLDRLFAECHGVLPSRRQLAAIAQTIRIQQSKIKKWFERRNKESRESQESYDPFWDELNRKMDSIDDQINEIKFKMSGE